MPRPTTGRRQFTAQGRRPARTAIPIAGTQRRWRKERYIKQAQHRASSKPRGTFRKITPDQRSAKLLAPALPRSIRIRTFEHEPPIAHTSSLAPCTPALAHTSSLGTDLTRNTRAPHFNPQHWLLCHMGLFFWRRRTTQAIGQQHTSPLRAGCEARRREIVLIFGCGNGLARDGPGASDLVDIIQSKIYITRLADRHAASPPLPQPVNLRIWTVLGDGGY